MKRRAPPGRTCFSGPRRGAPGCRPARPAARTPATPRPGASPGAPGDEPPKTSWRWFRAASLRVLPVLPVDHQDAQRRSFPPQVTFPPRGDACTARPARRSRSGGNPGPPYCSDRRMASWMETLGGTSSAYSSSVGGDPEHGPVQRGEALQRQLSRRLWRPGPPRPGALPSARDVAHVTEASGGDPPGCLVSHQRVEGAFPKGSRSPSGVGLWRIHARARLRSIRSAARVPRGPPVMNLPGCGRGDPSGGPAHRQPRTPCWRFRPARASRAKRGPRS